MIKPANAELPEVNETDTWTMDVWSDMRSGLFQGQQLELMRWRCSAERLDEPQTIEVLYRVTMIESVVNSWHADIAEAHRRAGG